MELGRCQQLLDEEIAAASVCVEREKEMEIRTSENGVTLIETLIAVLIAVVGVFSVGGLIFQGTVTNKNHWGS